MNLMKSLRRAAADLRHLRAIPDLLDLERSRVQLLIHREIRALRGSERYGDPRSLIPHGFKVYSQVDEDGILNEIFRRIGATSRTFVEFGVGNGLENNTAALLLAGWRGLWIEGNPDQVASIRQGMAASISRKRLVLLAERITKDNVSDLIREGLSRLSDPAERSTAERAAPAREAPEIDLLSIDVDGSETELFLAIESVNPRVVVLEYNPKFPPPHEVSIEYSPDHRWEGDDYHGASLSLLERKLAGEGYRLVGCSLSGVNAFFVRSDLTKDRFHAPFTAENHYEPARYFLTQLSSGHPPSYRYF